MSERIEFTRNYSDLSTNQGFQFEFKCAQCGARVSAGAKFCPECGLKVEVEQHCSHFGARFAAGAKFCPDCGQEVGV